MKGKLMKLQTWTCANGCGEWTTEVPDCFQYNGAEVLCVFCTINKNIGRVMTAVMSDPYATL